VFFSLVIRIVSSAKRTSACEPKNDTLLDNVGAVETNSTSPRNSRQLRVELEVELNPTA
jgi:hypothetical protein